MILVYSANGHHLELVVYSNYSAAFTLTTYAAVSDTMRKQSQGYMEDFFQGVKKAVRGKTWGQAAISVFYFGVSRNVRTYR